ncbi:MAG: hypothetical protein Q8S84_01995 [bacterium]|nr:hypothetical protein [bacterium]MDP3380327.1 hypothetical protein [bacterium]
MFDGVIVKVCVIVANKFELLDGFTEGKLSGKSNTVGFVLSSIYIQLQVHTFHAASLAHRYRVLVHSVELVIVFQLLKRVHQDVHVASKSLDQLYLA